MEPGTASPDGSAALFGFSRHEWAQARFDGPAASASMLAFFDAVTRAPPAAGLAGVSTESLLAIARVSSAFASRLGAHLGAIAPAWRSSIETSLGAGAAPAAGATEAMDQVRWIEILALIDAGS